jgi:acetolactate synthase-1/2/3 large subunit
MRQPGGHLLVECLVQQGVEVVFGVPGESYLAVLEGLHAWQPAIRFVTNRQEAGSAFMADAHARLTGRPGVCLVTRGPGAANAAIGLHTAAQDSVPLVMFVGDVASDMRDREAFQEIDFASFFGPNTKGLAKRVERIDHVDRIPEYVARAFATAMQGRPGPVVVVLPEDMLTTLTEARPVARIEPAVAAPSAATIQAMAQHLAQAKRPLVLAGGAGWTPQAAADLQAFAQAWQLPVANAFRFQDVFDNHHPCYAGDVGIGVAPALAQAVREADVLLALGCRLGEITTSGYTLLQVPEPRQALLHLHPAADELHRVYHAQVAGIATMPEAAAALAATKPPAQTPWQAHTQALRQAYLDNLTTPAAPYPIDLAEVVRSCAQLLPPEAVLTNGAGNFAGWLHRFFMYHGWAKGHKTQLAPTVGAMGYGVPAGIAANLVTGRTVLTFSGDGDFLMNGQELATAVQHGGRSIVVLLNNGMYGTIRMHQEREYPTHVSGSTLRNPDFCALANAYGYAAERVTRTADFAPALQRALAREQGTLLELPIDPEQITSRTTLQAIRQQALQRQQAPSAPPET